MPKHRAALGSEHPLCDKIQSIMLVLFFAVWGIDALSYFLFRISTIMVEFVSFPLLLFPAILSWCFGTYFALKSHVVFPEAAGKPKLIESGVYSWVSHPMYLGTFLFCLGFSFAIVSLLSLGVLIGFFVFYDKTATYEEKDLVSKLGQEYTSYKKRVPKWLPRLRRKQI
jgi:protein-S-isoprenylcysteine O-methyltransferase Ste14